MAEAEAKKIRLNFKGVADGDLVAMALETMASGGLAEGIAMLDAGRQIAALDKMRAAIEADRKVLALDPDYKAMGEAKTIDAQYACYKNMSKETLDFWSLIGDKEKAMEQLKFQLYLSSPHKEVRDVMQAHVDALIDKEITQRNTDKVTTAYWHDILYLSTFGGKMTHDRPDVWHMAYEFNAVSDTGYKPGVAWNPMESLFEAGMLKKYGEEQTGSNLTPIGVAVLKRLTETQGEPAAKKNFSQASPAV